MARRFMIIYSGRLKKGAQTKTALQGLIASLNIREVFAQRILDGGLGVLLETENEAEARAQLNRLEDCGLEVRLQEIEETVSGKGEEAKEATGTAQTRPADRPLRKEYAFRIIYTGSLLPGITTMTARAGLAVALGITDSQAHVLLDNGLGTIFETDDRTEADKKLDEFRAAGLEVRLEGSSSLKGDAAEKTVYEDEPQTLPFEFTGRGGEYFRIWLVNILLSLVTLGIYSAWAKVRRRQYFYSNTRLDGSSFEYLAKPIKILKGRILVVIILGIMWAFQTFLPLIGGLLSLGFWLVLPWLVIRSMKFNYYNTSYRHIRFGFEASYAKSFEIFILWPAIGILTLGILWPFVYRKQQEFLVSHGRYGQSRFEFLATTGQYYKIALGSIPILLLGAIVGMMFGLPLGAISNDLKYLSFFLTPYLLLLAYISVKRNNLLYNSTRLGRHGFECTQEVGSYLGLVVSNTILTAITLGLFHAWAKVRTARYKAKHLRLIARGGLDGFIAAEEKNQAAFGEELADMLDLDLGL